ncbi:uncharacterized protein VP01_3649g3 [Puccinia sorghi]|uniref:DUF8040 domain-containing protein n=1 Tax=Puccinia sorghi TaxID=27349 RepID=A0A0L6UWF6_9BASI|nr:uncharacterized protein VP01_3649g3 [Puccinia sorghi]
MRCNEACQPQYHIKAHQLCHSEASLWKGGQGVARQSAVNGVRHILSLGRHTQPGVCFCSNITLHITKSAMDPSEGDMNTMAAIILVTLLLPLAVHSRTRQIHYNDLDLTGANYTIAILRGNPRRCLAILRVPISKLLSMEEKLAIFLYITGHNNSNRLVQDRFQHSSETISKYVFLLFSLHLFLDPNFLLENLLYQALPPIA